MTLTTCNPFAYSRFKEGVTVAPDWRAVSILEPGVIWTELAPNFKLWRGIACVPTGTGGFPEVAVKVTLVKEEEGRGIEGGILYISWIF